MNYEDFKKRLQQEIQSNFIEHINFTSRIVNKTNETLEGLSMRFDGEAIAPTIYPEKMYEVYKSGMPVNIIAGNISNLLSAVEYPKMSSLTPENAQKYISFSVINKNMNRELLKECPHKEIFDLAVVPRWHISDTESFLVDNNMMQTLKMTKEEILDIAQKNTESASYTCKRMDEVVRDILLNDGIDKEVIEEMLSSKSPAYVISNEKNMDGSCAILSEPFLQKSAEMIGTDNLYLLPSSRHELIAMDASAIDDSGLLKAMVMDVNSDLSLVRKEDFLSDSIYQYNAKTHLLSMCDSRGLFHGNDNSKSIGIAPNNRKGRKIC